MSWSAISSVDVLSEMNSSEADVIKNVQNSTTNLDTIVQRVVNATRASIRVGGGQIDQEGTIPDQLRGEVIAIARWRWLLSLPGVEQLQSKARKEAYEDAIKRIDLAAEGKLKIELPVTPSNQAGPSLAVSMVRQGRRIHTGSFDKLGST